VFVTVRLFARLRELAGMPELIRELPDGATTRDAWEALAQEFPALAEYERIISCAVNAEYARWATPLRDGDEVAFLPPVSGGSRFADTVPLIPKLTLELRCKRTSGPHDELEKTR
jgi:molybdopterin synthase catalytic subunit